MEKRLLLFCFTLGLFGVALSVNSYLAFSALNSIDQSREILTEHHARAIAFANNLRFLQAAEGEQVLRFILNPDPNDLDDVQKTRANFKETANTLITIINPASEKERIMRILQMRETLAQTADPILSARLTGASIDETTAQLNLLTKNLSHDIGAELEILRKEEVTDYTVARARFESSLRTLEQYLVLSSAFMCLAFAAVIWLFWKLELRRREVINHTLAVAKARKEIIETVAHDLKNPLGAMQVSLEMVMEEKDQAVGSVADLLDIAYNSTKTMHRLVFDLLDHAKIESGNLSLATKHTDLCDISESLVKRFYLLASEKEISLQLEKPTTPIFAHCDEARIDQLMSNLIGNAIKFTPAHGQVTVRLESRMQEILLSVQDNGQGMSEDEVKHVFDRYWQVGATASKGTGLGLAISKAIAEAHRGKLWVESSEHKGSTFFVSLPTTVSDQFA